MRHFVSLSSALVLLAATLPVAHAASSTAWSTSTQCETILSLDPVSSYTQSVLQRADDALTAASSMEVDPAFQLFGWTNSVRSAFAKLIDVHLRITQQTNDLVNNSACLRFDLASIECKMDQVRNELHVQLDRGSRKAVIRLTDLLLFLNERYAQLSSGALDPTYRDTSWGNKTSFDDAATDYSNQNMCPYDTDYAPPQSNGFGCDLDVMSGLTAFDPLRAEHDALQTISDQLDTYREDAAAFLEVQQSIDTLFKKPSSLPEPPQPRTHLNMNGCAASGGICRNTSSQHCTEDADCGEGGQCLFPTKVCQKNENMRCIDNTSCMTAAGEDVGPCVDPTNKKSITTELRGPFSIPKNHLDLLMDFMATRIAEGNNRLFRDTLKTPDEFGAGQQTQKENRANDDLFTGSVRLSSRLFFALWSRIQGAGEATIFPAATDAQLQVAHSLTPLRDAVGDLARLTLMGGDRTLRGFVVKYAYFLRRSCIYRPCTASLDEVLKIVFADACFPYTNGAFLDDTSGNPRSAACADEAEITVP